jgi:phosphatidylglycerophosphate synthase
MTSPSEPRRLATRANALTLLRLIAAPAMAVAVAHEAHAAALGLFVLAVASDLLDGRVARRFGEATPFGGFADHATDALFVASGLAGLAWRGVVPPVLPPLVLAAFTQYALDSRALAGRALRTSALGRANGIAYFVLLGIPVVRDGLALGWPADALAGGIGWALVATTLVSMADRAIAWQAARRRRAQ